MSIHHPESKLPAKEEIEKLTRVARRGNRLDA